MSIEANKTKLLKIDKIITDCINDHDEIKSTRISLFENMIKTNMIDVNDALPIIVKKMKSISDIGMIVICLKNNVDRNIYVNAESLGPAHILLYAYNHHSEKLFEMFYIIMVLSGAEVTLPAYKKIDNQDGTSFYKKDKSKKSKENESLIKIESIYDWLKQKENFNLPAFPTELIEHVKHKNDKSIYGVYLDTSQFGKWQPNDIQYMLFSRNSKWKNVDTFNKDDGSLYLKIAINATFLDLVVNMLDSGLRPNYVDFSFWISHYKNIRKVHNTEYLINQIEQMFIQVIKRGFKIDLYYLDEIGSINPELRVTLYEEYQKPLYTKVCSNINDPFIPDEIKAVSVYLGIPDGIDKSRFCSSIESITQADYESLIRANRKRSTEAISSKINLLSDFINHTHFDGCTNISSFEENPLNYPIDLLAYYKDNDNQTWCFLSNDFESLLRNKVNPTTKANLPGEFLNRLGQQRDLLEYFDIPLTNPKTINKIISEIKKDDIISNKESDEIINRVGLILESNGYSEQFIVKKMKIRDIVNKFKRVDIDIQEILLLSESEYDKTIENAKTEFSPRIIYNLICYVLHDVLTKNIEQLTVFLK